MAELQGLVDTVVAQTAGLPDPTTLGSLMRRKMTPVTEPLQAQLAQLRGSSA